MSTLESLHSYLNSRKNGNQPLSSADEGAASLSGLFACLQQQEIAIKDMSVEPQAWTAQAQKIHLTGKWISSNLKPSEADGLSFACVFTQEAGSEIAFSLRLSGCQSPVAVKDFFGEQPQSRVAKDGILQLTESILNEFRLQNVELTTDSEKAYLSMPFSMKTTVSLPEASAENGVWTVYAAILGAILGVSATQATGEMALSDTFSFSSNAVFTLRVSLNQVLDNVFDKITGTSTNTAADCLADLCVHNGLPDPCSRWSSDRLSAAWLLLKMQPKGFSTPVEFSVPLFQSDSYWPLQVDFQQGLGISDIVNFFAGLFGQGSEPLLPPDTPLDFFKLYRLQVGANVGLTDGTGVSPVNMQALFSISKPWSLPIAQLSLDRLQALWQITWGKGSTGNYESIMTGEVAGQLSLGLGSGEDASKLTMSVTAQLPSFDIDGHLDWREGAWTDTSDEHIDLTKLMEGLGAGNLPEGMSGKQLGRLDLSARPSARSFSIYGELDDLVSFPIADLLVNLDKVYASIAVSPKSKAFALGGSASFGEGDDTFTCSLEAGYDSGRWQFKGGLDEGTISVAKLLKTLLSLEAEKSAGDLELKKFSFHFEKGGDKENEYGISAEFDSSWDIGIFQGDGSDSPLTLESGGKVNLEKKIDADKKSKLTADAEMQMKFGKFGVKVAAENFFQAERKFKFQVQYGKAYVEASYAKEKVAGAQHEIVRVGLGDVTLGEVVESMMHLVNPNQKAHLDGVWSVLNKIKLSSFFLAYDVTGKIISFRYQADLKIPELINIEEIGLEYSLADKKLNYVLTGSLAGKQSEKISWDAADGTPPEALPKKTSKFHLDYLGIGRHVEIGDLAGSTDIAQAVRVLQSSIHAPDGEETPLILYNDKKDWIFGADFTINDALQVRVALADPDLYGLLITVSDKATSYLSSLKGLSLELLYKKITEDIGMFKAALTIPEKFRRFDTGVFTIILGTVGIEIYTNGDFLLDLGFPKDGDFERSFSIEASGIIGRGGIRVGKLSEATCTDLPQTTKGVFHSILSLGVGISLGLGKTFDSSCLKGGATLEAFGIFEGILATFQPYGQGESSMYYRAPAMVGITGRLFLTVDFKVISASASAAIQASAKAILESYKPLKIELDMSLTVEASVKILFFKVGFSFHFNQHVSFVIPWNSSGDPAWLSADSRAALPSQPLNLSRPFPTETIGRIMIPVQIHPLVSMENATFTANLKAEQNPKYCVALMPIVLEAGCRNLMQLLGKWLLQGVTGAPYNPTAAISSGMAAQIPDNLADGLTYETLDEFLNNNLLLSMLLDWENYFDPGNNRLSTVIPMPPPVMQRYNNVETRYWQDNAVPSDYAQSITNYYHALNADPNYVPSFETNQLTGGSVPMAKILFLDYIQMLYGELVRSLKSQFDAYTFPASELVAVCKEQGLELAPILEKNPQLKLRREELRFTNLTIIVQPGDTLRSIQNKLKVPFEKLKEACMNQPGLIRRGAVAKIYGMSVGTHYSVPWKLLAANSFVRYHGEMITEGYQQYMTELLDPANNTGLSADWVSNQNSTKHIVLPYKNNTVLWVTLNGDTVLRLAKMLLVAQLPSGELPVWDEHWKKFAKRNNISETQGEELTGSYSFETAQITIPEDMSWNEMLLRYSFSSSVNEGEEYLSQDILKPLTPIILPEASVTPTTETTIGDVFAGKNLSVDHIDVTPAKLAELLLQYPDRLEPSQLITIQGMQHLTQAALLEQFTQFEFLQEAFGMGARFLLQGQRVPNPGDMDQTIPLYQLINQQLPAEPGMDFVVTMRVGQSGKKWVTFGSQTSTARMTYTRLQQLAPLQPLTLDVSPVKPLDSFRKAACYYPAASEILLRRQGGGEDQTIQMLSKAMVDAITYARKKQAAIEDETLLIPQGEFQNNPIDCTWGLLIPLEIGKSTGPKDVYQMYGADAADRLLLLELLQQMEGASTPDLQMELFYQPSLLQGLPASLTACGYSSESFLVKTNLSVETHRTSEDNRMIAENKYQAFFTQEDAQDLLWLIWECSTVGGGGYYLRFTNGSNESVLPDDIFDENNKARLWLFLKRDSYANPVNCALTQDTSKTEERVMFHAPGLISWQPAFPVGCIGLQTRLYPLAANASDQARNTRDLFNIVGYQIEKTADIRSSTESLPLLPTTASSETAGAWDYESVIPLYRFTRDEKLYSAVGKTTKVNFELRDLLGNRAKVENWSITYAPQYNDLLIGLNEWPCCSWDYTVEDRKLEVCCSIDASAKVTWESLELLERSMMQLECPDIKITVENSVFQKSMVYVSNPDSNLGQRPIRVILDFMNYVAAYMFARLNGASYPSGNALKLSVDLDAQPKSDLTRPRLLQTILRVQRTSGLNGGLPPKAIRTETLISPHHENSAENQPSLERFASNLEQSFPDLRLAIGNEENDLYVIRFGANGFIRQLTVLPSQVTIGSETRRTPEFYALPPLSNEWITRKLKVRNLAPDGTLPAGEGEEQLFSDIDMELWRDLILSDIERALDCDIASAAAQISLKANGNSEEKGKTLAELIDAKKELADILAQQIQPIRKEGTPASDALKKLAADRLKRLLTDPYMAVVAQYDCTLTTAGGIPCRITTKNLYNNPDVATRTSKLSNLSGENTFCVYVQTHSVHRNTPTKVLLQLCEIEYDIDTITSDGYQSSSWLQLVHPIDPLSGPLPSGIRLNTAAELPWPNPLKRCPNAPSLLSHKMLEPSSDEQAPVESVLQWDYQVTGRAKAYEQDTLHFKVKLNNKSFQSTVDKIFPVFAQYMYIRDSLWSLLEDSENRNTTKFIYAFGTFTDQIRAIKEALGTRKAQNAPLQDVQASNEVQSYDCSLQFVLGEHVNQNIPVVTKINDTMDLSEFSDVAAPTARYLHPSGLSAITAGQTVEVALTLPRLSLLKQHFALPSLWVERNCNLFDSLEVSVNPAFVYRTKKSSWPSLTPNREYGGIAGVKNSIAIDSSSMNMGELVDQLRKSLLLYKDERYGQFTISIAASYAYDLIPNVWQSAIRIPIDLIPDTPIGGSGADPFDTLEASLNAWCKNQAPSFANASFYFDVLVRLKNEDVSLGLKEGTQLLHLSKLRINVR